MAARPSISLRVSVDPDEAVRVLERFLADYLAAAGRSRFVLGLSGGIDSAVSAALAVRAVGPDRVHAYALPEAATSPTDLEDAQAVARQLGLAYRSRSIQPLLDAFPTAFPEADRLGLANAKARFRMILLYAEARRSDALVLGTGNKSELLTGYFTKYGDGGVDVQPLGDLYKTQVFQIAEHLGLPERVRTKPPTAGLWPGQTDEDELGLTYAILDRILLGIEIKLPHEAIAEIVGVPASEVERVERMRRASQHKRRLSLNPRIGIRTIGLDWRTPVLEA